MRMIVTDLDRTLLRTGGIISAYTADVLRRCRERGIKIVLATARPRRATIDFCLLLRPDASIFHNGAVIHISGDEPSSYGIAAEESERILQKLSGDYPDAWLAAEIDDTLYANFDVSQIWNNTAAVTTDFSDLPGKPADKILLSFHYPNKMTGDELKSLEAYLPDGLYAQISEGTVAMIMRRSATKWNAVQAAARRFHIPAAEIAAFGDDCNDIEMLRNCGTGVAVSNALAEVKAAADYICASNDEDGVAQWLEANLPL